MRHLATLLEAVGVAFQADFLVLQQAPSPLAERVAHPPPAPVYRDPDAGRRQPAGEGGAVN
jgi:hypothetical protein